MARLPQDDIEDNAEQHDADQAQDVAKDALGQGDDVSEDSLRPPSNDPGALIPDDVPDLVDKMNEMVRSGHIDNDAYAGEPMMDDEEDYLGHTDNDNDDDL